MPAFRNRFLLRSLAVLSAAVALTLPGRLAAEPTAPSLAQQLARAQEKGDHEAVLELCRRELATPGADTPKLLRLTFEEQVKTGDLTHAAGTLAQLSAVQPPPAPATLAELRGNLLQAQEKPLDEILAAWREALAARPADPAGLQGQIADALDRAGRWEEAADAFRAALRLAPNHPARRARLAVCLLNAGHSLEADQQIQAAARADAADETVKAVAPMFDRLRLQLSALRNLDACIAAGKLLSTGSPFDVSSGVNTSESASLDRALLLYRAEAYAGALTDAARASKLTQNDSLAARLLQGQCLWQLERGEEATALGIAKMANKQWFNDPKSFDRLRKADQVSTYSVFGAIARAHTVRATVMLEAEQPTLALTEARLAHQTSENGHQRLDDTEVVFAVACLRNGLAEEGFAAARRATDFAPQNPDGWAIWGRLEQETRADFAAAAGYLSRALALREDPRWLRRRETCLRALGRTAEADRDAQRLVQINPAS